MLYTSYILSIFYIRARLNDETLLDSTLFDDNGAFATTPELAAQKTLDYITEKRGSESWADGTTVTGTLFCDNDLAGLFDIVYPMLIGVGDGFVNSVQYFEGSLSLVSVVEKTLGSYTGTFPQPSGYEIHTATASGSWGNLLSFSCPGTITSSAEYSGNITFLITGLPDDTAQLPADVSTYPDDQEYNYFNLLREDAEPEELEEGLLVYNFDMTDDSIFDLPVSPEPTSVCAYRAIHIPGLAIQSQEIFELTYDTKKIFQPQDGEPFPLKYTNGVNTVSFKFGPAYDRWGQVRPAKDGGFLCIELDGEGGNPTGNIYVFRNDRTLAVIAPVSQLNNFLP